MYSSTLFELIIFAGIAFFLISKLIDMLGTVDEDDPAKSFFGERGIKDVTNNVSEKQQSIIQALSLKIKSSVNKYKNFLVFQDQAGLVKLVNDANVLKTKINSFDIEKFINASIKVFAMIFEAKANKDMEMLNYLVDKRFIRDIMDNEYDFDKCTDVPGVAAKICEIYFFGNSAFVKVRFSFNIDFEVIKEDWVFLNNMLDNSPNWQLTSVSRV